MIAVKAPPPFFSIILPTYNRAAFILKALKSILTQQFNDYEIIIVDDGSTDNTYEILTDIISENKSVKYFLKNNEERSIARNFGIAKASGRYIGFLDSDDVVYPNHLSVAYELLKKNNFPEVAHLGYECITTTGKKISICNNFDPLSFREELINENSINSNAIFIKKEVVMEITFIPSPSAVLSEDWYVWLRLASRYSFYFDNTITSAIVQHSERSLLNVNPDKLILSTNIIVEFLQKDTMFLSYYKTKTNFHFANHYTFLALILSLTKKRKSDTLKYLLESARYDLKVIFRKRFLASIKHLMLGALRDITSRS